MKKKKIELVMRYLDKRPLTLTFNVPERLMSMKGLMLSSPVNNQFDILVPAVICAILSGFVYFIIIELIFTFFMHTILE